MVHTYIHTNMHTGNKQTYTIEITKLI